MPGCPTARGSAASPTHAVPRGIGVLPPFGLHPGPIAVSTTVCPYRCRRIVLWTDLSSSVRLRCSESAVDSCACLVTEQQQPMTRSTLRRLRVQVFEHAYL